LLAVAIRIGRYTNRAGCIERCVNVGLCKITLFGGLRRSALNPMPSIQWRMRAVSLLA